MHAADPSFGSVPGICEVIEVGDAGAGRAALLFEVPHGATRRADYERTRSRLDGDLPDDLIDYFFANTDVGSTEYALAAARLCSQPDEAVWAAIPAAEHATTRSVLPHRALVIRCLVPRTFIDTNRIIDTDGEGGGLTAALADFIRDEADRATLQAMHAAYHEVVDRAFAHVCGVGSLGVTPHTYAPRSIFLPDEDFDEGIGRALRRAYSAESYTTWELRPPVDVISRDTDDRQLTAAPLIAALRDGLRAADIDMAENASYRLHPATMGHRYAARYPQQVLCLEVRRDLVGDPFEPFDETSISDEGVQRVAVPLAAALLRELGRRATVG